MSESKYVERNQVEGKTIAKSVRRHGYWLLAFTDGTYTGGAAFGEREDDVYIEDYEPRGYDLVTLDLITDEEYGKYLAAEREERERRQKDARRIQYETLKQEFEEETPNEQK